MAEPLKKLTVAKLLGITCRRIFNAAADVDLEPSASFVIGLIIRRFSVRIRDQLNSCGSLRDGTTQWLIGSKDQ